MGSRWYILIYGGRERAETERAAAQTGDMEAETWHEVGGETDGLDRLDGLTHTNYP